MKFVARNLTQTTDISRGKFSLVDFLKTICSAIITLAALYFLISLSANWLADNISDELENEWLSKPYHYLSDDADNINDIEMLKRPQRILDRLVNNGPLRQLNYRLSLVNNPSVNAFAFPGGGIGVTTGLLEKIETEEGIAFILAHELAHHDRRHVLKQFWRTILWRLFIELAGLGGGSVENFLLFSNTHYSRQAEREADSLALQLVYPLYGDQAESYIDIFHQIQKGDNNGHWGKLLLSTHPDTRQRIDAIRRRVQELNTEK